LALGWGEGGGGEGLQYPRPVFVVGFLLLGNFWVRTPAINDGTAFATCTILVLVPYVKSFMPGDGGVIAGESDNTRTQHTNIMILALVPT
jgi:hypothetical protein